MPTRAANPGDDAGEPSSIAPPRADVLAPTDSPPAATSATLSQLQAPQAIDAPRPSASPGPVPVSCSCSCSPVDPTSPCPIAAALARGDHAALESLYDLWLARAVALARSITRRDESFALDIAHDAFLRAIRTPPTRAHTRGQLDAWMTRTVHSAALDMLKAERRRAQRERLHVDQREPAQSTAPSAPANEPVGTARHVDATDGNDGIDAAERAQFDLITQLARRLEHLDEHDRFLIQMRTARGLSLKAIAAALGSSVNAVHGQIRRALARVRSHAEPSAPAGSAASKARRPTR